jgi:uncharacterized repeat protein (TIGR01451 family)
VTVNNGGTLSPGTSPDVITTGNLTLTSGSTLAIELLGPTVRTRYDQVNVTGTVDLGSATLNVSLGFTPTAGQVFTIINNDGSADAVTGMFAGLPEGSTFTLGGRAFRVSYMGGDGNDVTLTALGADLDVTKSGPATITAGNNITYTVGVTNNGPSDAQSVMLSDMLPAGTTFVSEAQNTGPAFACNNPSPGGTGTVSCTIGTLASGASATFTLVFNVAASTAGGTVITNTASANSATTDPASGNNSQATSATVNAPTPTPTATATATATATPTVTATATATATPSPGQLLNISTRVRVETGDKAMIGGFIVTGVTPKKVFLRGIGPSLARFGLSDLLLDPVLELRGDSGALILRNDNWKDDQRSQIEGTPFQPNDDRESVIVATLPPRAYTAILTGKNNTSGLGLVEVYDGSTASDSELANISTRGFVQTQDKVMIGGFTLGKNNSNAQIAARALGPSLIRYGLSNVLADPTLQLFDANGTVLVANDNWQDDPVSAAKLTANGLALSDPKESGIFATLPPGQFTAILAGKNGGTGIGLVELYNVK